MTDQQTMQTFEESIKQHLVDNRKELVSQAVTAAIGSLAESLKWTALDAAKTQLQEFFKTDVAPEVTKMLDANKEQFIASVVATIREVIDYGLKKQAEDWMKEMDSSYSRSAVISKMFGGRGY